MKGRVLQLEIPLNEMNKDMEACKRSSLGPQRRKRIGGWHERRLKRMRGTRTGIGGGGYNVIIITVIIN